KLAARLGERLIPSTLELSGHDACLILPDADLDLAARGIYFGTTVNSGQTCVCCRRILVPRNLLAALEEKLQALARQYPHQRRLAMSSQKAFIEGLANAAIQEGARILLPATRQLPENDGAVIILSDVVPAMRICQEALFAPVSMLMPYEELTEALAAIRSSDYGLAFSIFTENPSQAREIIAQVPCGLATINDLVVAVGHPATPFGGVGRSGWGVAQGAEGLLELTTPQVISSRLIRWRPHFEPMGSTAATNEEVLSRMLQWEHSPTWWQRTRSFFGLLAAFRRAGQRPAP
ncbi:MAG TPA: aldehyde dehydrogenase family protein, partial [Gemmatales bacterium]|nr:aldehyde dehydrogenase family protein [Gemmatales bacterium]